MNQVWFCFSCIILYVISILFYINFLSLVVASNISILMFMISLFKVYYQISPNVKIHGICDKKSQTAWRILR